MSSKLAIPAWRLWRAIKDSQLFAKAVKPLVVKVEDVKGGGETPAVGDIRIVHLNTELVSFPFVKEELTYLDEESLTVKGKIGTQLSSYSMTISLKPKGDAACTASWTTDYEVIIDKPDLDKLLESFAGTFKAVEAYLLSLIDYS